MIGESKHANVREFFVPLLPPSVNHYKTPNGRGGFFVTRDAIAFRDAVCIFARAADVQGNLSPDARVYYEVDLVFSIERAKFLKRDADNLEKVALDALKNAQVIVDDRYIVFHSNRNRADEGVRYVVTTVEG